MPRKNFILFLSLFSSLYSCSRCDKTRQQLVKDMIDPSSSIEFVNTNEKQDKIRPNLDSANMGLVLYPLNAVRPTCMAHGIVYDSNNQHFSKITAPYQNYNKWIEKAVKQHNEYRVKMGFQRVQLSHKLTEISQAYAILLVPPPGKQEIDKNITLSKEANNPISTNGAFNKLDIYHEETYYNENIRFQAPDFIASTSLACCPAYFTKKMSPDSREIGISRYIHNVMGNFNRLVIVAVFHPKSDNWIDTKFCETDDESFMESMNDDNDYIDPEEEKETNAEIKVFQAG